MPQKGNSLERNELKEKLHEIIFEADTPMGKFFDVVLMIFIIASVLVVMLETVGDLNVNYHGLFVFLEWTFTIFFTIEYFLRIYVVRRPKKYIFSFFGIIDLLAIIPTYISLIGVGTQSLVVIRALRLLRVFRIFKLANFLNESQFLIDSLKRSRAKIFVFLFFILLMVCILGSVMYLVEGGVNSEFDSIPRSIYWAIVTLTTVGYGDIHPITAFGQFIAAFIMILGYSVIAVPTGIITSEVMKGDEDEEIVISTQACRYCAKEGHDVDAEYCKYCGELLNESLE